MFTNIAGKLKGLAIIQTIIFIAFGIIIWTLPYQTGGLANGFCMRLVNL